MAGATIKGYISKRISATLCRWMLSYGIVLALPVLFGGIIYGDALAREQKNVHRIQHQAMYSVQTYLLQSAKFQGSSGIGAKRRRGVYAGANIESVRN